MNGGKFSKETRSPLGANRPVIAAFGLLAVGIVAVNIYVIVSYILRLEFTWLTFGLLALYLLVLNSICAITAWRERSRLKLSVQLIIVDWTINFALFWSLGLFYEYLVGTYNFEQLNLHAILFFTLVPIMIFVAIIIGQVHFRPLARYLETGLAADPERLYKRLTFTPWVSVFKLVSLTMVGYIIGQWMLMSITRLPLIEGIKGFGTGVVLSFFMALIYYLAYFALLGPLRSELRSKYHIAASLHRFYWQIFVVVTLITFNSLLMVVLIFVQAMQKSTENYLTGMATSQMESVAGSGTSTTNLASLRLGARGKAWELLPGDPLPEADVSPELARHLQDESDGVLRDNIGETKLVVFHTYSGVKLVSLIYPDDFYGGVLNIVAGLFAGLVFVGVIAMAVTTIFNWSVTLAISKLINAVRRAKKTHQYVPPAIHTGDEFEVLSEAYVDFTREINDRASQLQSEKARLRSSIESLSHGFVMTDRHGKVILTNKQLDHILGRPGPGGWTVAALSRRFGNTLDMEAACKTIIDAGKPLQRDILAGRQDLRVFIEPVASLGQIIGVVALVRDISEEKILERSKNEFFAIASHELRTPLTAIKGNVSIIKELPEHMKDTRLADMMNEMDAASSRLIRIVNDFLDVSRLEQGKMVMNIGTLNIADVMKSVIGEVGVLAEEKKLYLKVNLEALAKLSPVAGDLDRVKQVACNIIGNAIKMTAQGGVTVDAVQHGGFVRITVSDTGGGIPAENQKLLFHSFQQAADSYISRPAGGGTGLGLYISKGILEQMGGAIRLERSEVGKGSAFSFDLPLAKVPVIA